MRDYVIVTDSSCDLPEDLVRHWDLTVVPLSVEIGPDRFRNTPEEAPDGHVFYSRLVKGEPVKTSAPNVEEFKDYLRPHLQAGKDILNLAFSSALSATYQNACIAAEELMEEFPDATVLTVDTLAASLGQGMLVDLALEQQRLGKSLFEVRDWVEASKLHLCHWFTVGDLSQLRRGGRLSAGKAILGNLLHIKPVLHVDDGGRLVPMDSVKGRKKSIEAMFRMMEETVTDPASQRIYISHGDCPEDAQLLADMAKERLGVQSVTIGYVGPVIGAHSGYRTLALFFLGDHR